MYPIVRSVENLAEAWRERECDRALGEVCPLRPWRLRFTEDWTSLRAALTRVRASAADQLTAAETVEVERLIVTLGRALSPHPEARARASLADHLRLDDAPGRSDTDEVRRLLLAYWDPIGVAGMDRAPLDEYDAYLPMVVSAFQPDRGETWLADYLTHVRTRRIGLKADPEGDREAAREVFAWHGAKVERHQA